jgi:hypothetical protein
MNTFMNMSFMFGGQDLHTKKALNELYVLHLDTMSWELQYAKWTSWNFHYYYFFEIIFLGSYLNWYLITLHNVYIYRVIVTWTCTIDLGTIIWNWQFGEIIYEAFGMIDPKLLNNDVF